MAFSAFTGASLRSALAGAPTCGCFGTIMVDPAFVFVLDSGVVLALLLTPARHGSPSIARWGMVEVYGVAAIALIALLVSGPAASSVAALEANPSEYVFSRGRQLVQASTLAKPLSSGDWRVLFHRPGCEACRASVERFVRPEARVSIRHAMIEVARRSASVQERNVHGVLTGRLGDDAAFVETPLLLELRAGVVTRINFRGLAEEDAR